METKLSKFTLCLSKLWFLFLISCLREGTANDCKDVIWLPKKSGSYLRNHIIENMTVSSHTMCKIMCYLSNTTCLSYNYHHSTGTCEINDSDAFQHPEDLIPMEGYTYTGTENGCQSKPCSGNKTCQVDFTYEGGYNCLCPSGFTGASCETDIDECTPAHGNSCPGHSTCVNTVGSYKCRCNVGYKKSGQECLPRKGTKDSPGKSCLSILNFGDSLGTGQYWLDPKNTGNPIKAFCDMTTDGGGWTFLKRLYLETPEIPFQKTLLTYDAAISGGPNISQNLIPTGQAMLEILQVMGYHQIHFYCYKKSVDRVVSIMTKNTTAGQQVLRYFTTAAATDDFPDACHSFDSLPEDTSILGHNCQQWGKDKDGNTGVNKWGLHGYHAGFRISTFPFAIWGADKYGFSCYRFQNSAGQGLCDDDKDQQKPLNVNDTWQIAVR